MKKALAKQQSEQQRVLSNNKDKISSVTSNLQPEFKESEQTGGFLPPTTSSNPKPLLTRTGPEKDMELATNDEGHVTKNDHDEYEQPSGQPIITPTPGEKGGTRPFKSATNSSTVSLKLQQEQAKMKARHLKEKLNLLNQIQNQEEEALRCEIELSRNSRASNSISGSLSDRTSNWVAEHATTKKATSKVHFSDFPSTSKDGGANTKPVEGIKISDTTKEHFVSTAQLKDFTFKNMPRIRQSTPAPWVGAPDIDDQMKHFWNTAVNPTDITLANVTARNFMPRELPKFSGDPREWPMFISSFLNSTSRCGLTNDENMERLKSALKGDALNAVRTKLIIPDMVPDAIYTLRMLFGRPELIIEELIGRVRSERPIKDESLNQLIQFSLLVDEIVNTMEAAKLEDHLRNPMLLNELIEKLPSRLKIDWVLHKRKQPTCNLGVFSKWLHEIASAASEVTKFVVNLDSRRPVQTKKGPYEAVHFNVEAQKEPKQKGYPELVGNKIEKRTTMKRTDDCIICEEKHLLSDCRKFLDMPRRERWDFIIENKICGACFGAHHYRFCRSRERCEIDGCKSRHNKLLHNYKPTEQKVEPQANSVLTNRDPECNQILFRILPISLANGDKVVRDYAFVDEGSSITMMDESLADSLGLRGPREELCLKWTGETTKIESSMRVDV